MSYRIGIDIGGTFTDFTVLDDDGRGPALEGGHDAGRPGPRRSTRASRRSPRAARHRASRPCSATRRCSCTARRSRRTPSSSATGRASGSSAPRASATSSTSATATSRIASTSSCATRGRSSTAGCGSAFASGSTPQGEVVEPLDEDVGAARRRAAARRAASRRSRSPSCGRWSTAATSAGRPRSCARSCRDVHVVVLARRPAGDPRVGADVGDGAQRLHPPARSPSTCGGSSAAARRRACAATADHADQRRLRVASPEILRGPVNSLASGPAAAAAAALALRARRSATT